MQRFALSDFIAATRVADVDHDVAEVGQLSFVGDRTVTGNEDHLVRDLLEGCLGGLDGAVDAAAG